MYHTESSVFESPTSSLPFYGSTRTFDVRPSILEFLDVSHNSPGYPEHRRRLRTRV